VGIEKIDIVESMGWWILCVILPAIGFLGILLHYFFCSRLSFFKFNGPDPSDTSDGRSANYSNKGSLQRIIIPLLAVAGASAILPFCLEYHPDLHDILNRNEELRLDESVRWPWNYLLPVIAMEATIFTCSIVGSFYYFLIGGLAYCIGLVQNQ